MSDKPKYCHKCKAWHSPTDAGWKAGCVSELAPSGSTNFDVWWHNEGSGMPPMTGEDAETHVRRICEIAWSNGAYKAMKPDAEH